MGPHLGVLRAETIVIGWMGSSAAFQTLTPQSLCFEVFGFFSLFNLVPGWEKLLMALTRKTTKFFTGWYLDGCISARLAFRVLCQCIAHRYCLLAALVCWLCIFSKLGMLWCSPRCTTPFSRVRVVFRGAPLVFGVVWFGCETGRIHAGRRACSNVLSFATWLDNDRKLQVEVWFPLFVR